MIHPKDFYDYLIAQGLDFYAGVPDSLLKDICNYIMDHTPEDKNIITANEGGAIGLAIGYHLATNSTPVVYMQNSGFGNIVNPLLSLADREVYSIPMLLMIGWRGEPGVKDEPQHIKQGRISTTLLDAMELPYCILGNEIDVATNQVKESLKLAIEESRPVAILVRKGTFETYKLQSENSTSKFEMKREDAIKTIVDFIDKNDIVVSTTGMASRELYEYRDLLGHSHANDFLTVGGMGHASQIALGIAQQKNNRIIYCLDGDGASIMHMGALPIIGSINIKNYKHIIINNGAHDSVGGQPTVGFKIDFCAIAKASGYAYAASVNSNEKLKEELSNIQNIDSPCLLEIKVMNGARKDLGRPKSTPKDNKEAFMTFIKN